MTNGTMERPRYRHVLVFKANKAGTQPLRINHDRRSLDTLTELLHDQTRLDGIFIDGSDGLQLWVDDPNMLLGENWRRWLLDLLQQDDAVGEVYYILDGAEEVHDLGEAHGPDVMRADSDS